MAGIQIAGRWLGIAFTSLAVAGCSTQPEQAERITDSTPPPAAATNGEPAPAAASPEGTPPAAAVTSAKPDGIDLAKLPVPADSKSLFANADVAMYVCEMSVDEAQVHCQRELLAQGWKPYGGAGTVAFYKKGLTRLSANIAAAPAQGGKTSISYTREALRVDLPAPDKAQGVHYADSNKQLSFDTELDKSGVAAYYRSTLGADAWQATTENWLPIGIKEVLIFRNPAKDLLTLEVAAVDGKQRVNLIHQSAAEVEEQERRMDEAIKKKQAALNQAMPKLPLSIPADAQGVTVAKSKIEFKIGNGKVKPLMEKWRKELAAAGWTEQQVLLEAMVGVLALKKESQTLTINYNDTDILPAEVTIQASGVELERAPAQP